MESACLEPGAGVSRPGARRFLTRVLAPEPIAETELPFRVGAERRTADRLRALEGSGNIREGSGSTRKGGGSTRKGSGRARKGSEG